MWQRGPCAFASLCPRFLLSKRDPAERLREAVGSTSRRTRGTVQGQIKIKNEAA